VKTVADRAGDLAPRCAFSSLTDQLKSARAAVDELTGLLARARSRGYRYNKALEGRLAEAGRQGPEATAAVLQESRGLGDRLRPRIDALLARARALAADRDLTQDGPAVDLLEDELRDLDDELDAAERRLGALAGPVVDTIKDARAALTKIHALLDKFEAASFKLQAGENPIAAVGASWEDAQGGAKKGVLFLTDDRVRFEHDEEVVTKKTLFFFAAETKRVQQLLIDEPIGHLASSDDATRGWVFKDQLLAFAWTQSAKGPKKTTFELESGTAKEWDTLVESIKDGSIAADAVEGSAPAAPVVLRFPEKCTGCGANLPAPTRGNKTLSCPYCGTVHQPLT
jgi:hypothetical protein